MQCPSCSESIAEDSAFCRHCGVATSARTKGDGGVVTNLPVAASSSGKSIGDLDPNIAGALTYVFGFVTGLIFFLLEEEDRFVRFHAVQSMVIFGTVFVLSVIVSVLSLSLAALNGMVIAIFGVVFALAWLLMSLGVFVLWIYLIVKAYKGDRPRIPVAAAIADELV